MIKLCYKEYPFKITLKACKTFYDNTGLDLQTVFMDYLVGCVKSQEMVSLERLAYFSKIYTRDVACQALHAIISQENKNIPMSEIEDATFRVSWTASDVEDDMQEPWPLVMVATAVQINDCFKEMQKKKPDTSEAA